MCNRASNLPVDAAALLVLQSRLSCWAQLSTEQQKQDTGCNGRLPQHTDNLEPGRAPEPQGGVRG